MAATRLFLYVLELDLHTELVPRMIIEKVFFNHLCHGTCFYVQLVLS